MSSYSQPSALSNTTYCLPFSNQSSKSRPKYVGNLHKENLSLSPRVNSNFEKPNEECLGKAGQQI